MKKIEIIGGGIGGLTTAIILKNQGIKVSVFEGAKEIKPVGAGIIIANNAMQIYRNLGLDQKITEAGNPISVMKITDEFLRPLSVLNLQKFEEKYQVKNVAIHRGELQRILAESAGMENIFLSKKLVKVSAGNKYQLSFQDGTVEESEILIGADGIRSVVRDQLMQAGTIRNSGQICWRGICNCEIPERYFHEANEAWGRGKRFGYVKIGNNKVYWYALRNSVSVVNKNEDLLNLFSDFHPDILKIIASTSPENIICNDIIDLKPTSKWFAGNACLIGDAAHATTPNLGQGANQAVEDAYILGKSIGSSSSISEAFGIYQKTRIKKAHMIVNTSWQFGKVSQLENRAAVWIRNNLMRLMPDSMNFKQIERIFEIDEI
jgi:2-polyprenyl-6-methoxyphenol hydroxylase-like FAD-dependent oxidoreductase